MTFIFDVLSNIKRPRNNIIDSSMDKFFSGTINSSMVFFKCSMIMRILLNRSLSNIGSSPKLKKRRIDSNSSLDMVEEKCSFLYSKSLLQYFLYEGSEISPTLKMSPINFYISSELTSFHKFHNDLHLIGRL